jgi:hypothetical protein
MLPSAQALRFWNRRAFDLRSLLLDLAGLERTTGLHVGALQLGRVGGVLRRREQPGLGVGQFLTAHQSAADVRPAGAVPPLRQFADARVLANPGNVGIEGSRQRRQGGIEIILLPQENIVQSRQTRRHIGVGDRPIHERRGE